MSKPMGVPSKKEQLKGDRNRAKKRVNKEGSTTRGYYALEKCQKWGKKGSTHQKRDQTERWVNVDMDSTPKPIRRLK